MIAVPRPAGGWLARLGAGKRLLAPVLADWARRPLICVNGREDEHGRALLAVSALYLAADSLRGHRVRLIDVESPDVRLAAEVLGFDLGLAVECRPPRPGHAPDSDLAGARLYLAVACKSAEALHLAAARRLGVPVVAAVQHPDGPVPQGSAPAPDPFDTRSIAGALAELLRPQGMPAGAGLAACGVAREPG